MVLSCRLLQAWQKRFGSEPQDGPRKIGSFLMQSIYQVNTITSAMFQTSMAGNTLVAALALQSFGIGITWGDWAMAAIVPGVIALIIMPYFIYKVYPPEIKDAREAQQMIKEELKGLGKMSFPRMGYARRIYFSFSVMGYFSIHKN